MVLKKLTLAHFRNFPKKEIEFSPQTTLIVGKNASGKTNLLEAVSILSVGRSFRGGRDEEMIGYQDQVARVEGQIDPQEKLEIVLTRGEVAGVRAPKKRYLVNRVVKRAMDFVGILRVVLFRPEDLEIVINSPSTRRDYLDSVLEPVDREYHRALLSYQKGLRQRNKVLEQIREGQTQRPALFFWDKLLIENGQLMTQKRKEFIEFINGQPDYFGDLEIGYDRSVISTERLAKHQRAEVAAAMTLVGPHRDDFKIQLKTNGLRDLSIFGSRGEQRLAVFSLKLAELEFVIEKTEERPLLLLDDIFSELDHGNRQRLLEVVPKQQTLITATDLHLIDEKFRAKMEKINLS